MKPSDILTNKAWFKRYDHRRIGALVLLSLTLKQIEAIAVDEDAFTAITGDTLVLAAFCTARGQKRLVLGFLEKPLALGEIVFMVDFDEVGHDVVQITSFFATAGGPQYMGLGGDPENIGDEFFKAACNLFATRGGMFMRPNTHTCDLRMVGDTSCTIMRIRDAIAIMQNLVILGFASTQHLLIAAARSGGLFMQSIGKLARFPRDIDATGTWQPLKGIGSGEDIFRVGRVIARGNQLHAPIAARLNSKIANGEVVIDLATNIVATEYGAEKKFLITANLGSDANADPDPGLLKLVTYDEGGALGVDTSITGYARYRAAAEAQQST